MNSIIQLHNVYRKQGYTIRTGLYPWHFRCNAYRSLPLSSVFQGNSKLSAGGGLAFVEMFFFSQICPLLNPRNIFIVGNAFGLSAVLLALLNPAAKVVAIDAGIEGVDNADGTTLTRQIAAQEGLNLEVIKGFSPVDVPRVINQYLDGRVDFVFIDGLHTNEQQQLDFDACWAFGGPMCTYVFHDVLNYRMMEGFSRISDRQADMQGEILWRTPSGMGLLFPMTVSAEVRCMVDLFTQSSEMLDTTRHEIRIEKFVSLPLIRSIPRILPASIIRRLRRLIYLGEEKARQ